MPQYRKRPVVIEAFQLLAAGVDATEEYIEQFHAFMDDADWYSDYDEGICIQTLWGTTRADQGDWIVRGVRGEVYPVKPDIFEMTYEKV